MKKNLKIEFIFLCTKNEEKNEKKFKKYLKFFSLITHSNTINQ